MVASGRDRADLDGQVSTPRSRARAVRAAAAAEAERVRGELATARADAARPGPGRAGPTPRARQVRALAGLPAAGGQATRATGLTVRARCPGVTVGEVVAIERAAWTGATARLQAEVVGFSDDTVVLMPLGELAGVGPGAAVIATGGRPFRAGRRSVG
jgi:hypothetical protein